MRDIREPSTAASPRPECVQRIPGAFRQPVRRARYTGVAIALAVSTIALGGLLPAPAPAIEFGDDGAFQGSLDTTISHGVTLRVADRDDNLTGINSDDGDRNYDRGLVSNASKFTSELELGSGSFGVFARATGFLDFENQNGEREYIALTEEAKDRVGKDLELLDAYVTGAFDVGDTLADVRLGKHVLNWGESTFIQNGINVINPFDVSKLRTPGSELREGLEPVSLVSLAVAPTETLSLEGFYQLQWAGTEPDPSGTYFSTNDYGTPGGTRAFFDLPGANVSDMGGGFGPLTPAINADIAAAFAATIPGACVPTSPGPPPTFAGPACQSDFDPGLLSVSRIPDREPSDSGQWGLALRFLAEDLNDTEFGVYFINHHSRLPFASANFGTLQGYQVGLATAQAVTADGSNTIAAIAGQATPAVTSAVTEAVTRQITAGVAAQVPPGTPQAVIDQQVAAQLALPETQQQIGAEIRNQVEALVGNQVGGVAQVLAIDRYGKTANYYIEYPEDLRVFGVSFSTVLGTSGWALQGEYSFHPDAPLQREEQSLFTEGLSPLIAALRQSPAAPALRSRLGGRLDGYIERDVSQVQVTATKVLGPILGSDGLAFITEAALTHVHGMPDRSQTPLDSPGTGDALADATSWGYRAAARLDYNNAIGAARVSPYVQFQHDVSGNSPGPGGPFVDGRTVLTLGAGVNYLERWQAGLSYTIHSGDKNYLSDRDFISASVKYSF